MTDTLDIARSLLVDSLDAAFQGFADVAVGLVLGYVSLDADDACDYAAYAAGAWARLRDPWAYAARRSDLLLLTWARVRAAGVSLPGLGGSRGGGGGGGGDSAMLTLLRLSREHGAWPWAADIGLALGRGGSLGLLRWAHAAGAPLGAMASDVVLGAAERGHLGLLRWAHAVGFRHGAVCAAAAGGGHLAALRWARRRGYRWGDTCLEAAAGGNLGVLQWAAAAGCPWDPSAWEAAAKGGHLPVLEWACTQGDACHGLRVPLRACCMAAAAARHGHLAVLRWLDRVGLGDAARLTTSVTVAAAECGLEIVRWVLDQGWPRAPGACRAAALRGNLATFRLLHTGWPGFGGCFGASCDTDFGMAALNCVAVEHLRDAGAGRPRASAELAPAAALIASSWDPSKVQTACRLVLEARLGRRLKALQAAVGAGRPKTDAEWDTMLHALRPFLPQSQSQEGATPGPEFGPLPPLLGAGRAETADAPFR